MGIRTMQLMYLSYCCVRGNAMEMFTYAHENIVESFSKAFSQKTISGAYLNNLSKTNDCEDAVVGFTFQQNFLIRFIPF